MICLGVDPGKKGGYSFIIGNQAVAFPWDDSGFVRCVEDLAAKRDTLQEPIACAVEKVAAMPGQGVSSMFSFGKAAGYIEGVLVAFSIPYQLIPPVKWKAEFGLLHTDKARSIEVCKKLFPGVSLMPTERCRKESDGMAESLLLALYARRKL